MRNAIDRALDLTSRASRRLDWLGPLAARVVIGVTFVVSGWGKLHGLDNVTQFFTDLGIPAPAFNALLVASTELVGGALLLLGLLTRVASVALLTTMIVAIIAAQLPNLEGGFVGLFGLTESTYAAVFVWLAVAGAGRLSLDHLAVRRWAARGPDARPAEARVA